MFDSMSPGKRSPLPRYLLGFVILAGILVAGWALNQRSGRAAAGRELDPAGDWPMWHGGEHHTAATPVALPPELVLQWARDLGRPEPAWPWSQDKLQFDATYEPVVLGKTIFVPSMRTDSVTAYDIESGRKRWDYFAEGPVRFAPVAARGKIWFGSDDGCLYCLDAATGALRWKFRAVPSNHKTLGNERIISTWPVRGAPVLHEGTLYFAAGVWPAMGIYLYALDAETGNVRWLNSGDGMVWQDQPHAAAAKSFAGVSPQGCLAVAGERLLVPSSRAVPGAYDLASGRFLYARLADNSLGKNQGGHAVAVEGDYFFCGPGHNRPAEFGNMPGMFALADGKSVKRTRATVLTPEAVYQAGADAIEALDPGTKNLTRKWTLAAPGCTEVFCKAGGRLYAGGPGKLAAIDDQGDAGALAWEKTIAGTPATGLAAGGRLFVVTLEGLLYCYGAGTADAAIPTPSAPQPPAADEASARVTRLLEATGERDGYCFVTGGHERPPDGGTGPPVEPARDRPDAQCRTGASTARPLGRAGIAVQPHQPARRRARNGAMPALRRQPDRR